MSERRPVPDIRELANHDRPGDRSSPGWLLLAATASIACLLAWSVGSDDMRRRVFSQRSSTRCGREHLACDVVGRAAVQSAVV